MPDGVNDQLSVDLYVQPLAALLSQKIYLRNQKKIKSEHVAAMGMRQGAEVLSRVQRDAECAIRYSQSAFAEDVLLLPSLLRATRLQPGTFVELGALDGIRGSNTFMLER